MNSFELQSKTISFLRFPLIVFVIIVHSDIVSFATNIDIETTPIYFYIQQLIALFFSKVAVILFFFFSGYLFFLKVSVFNKDIYIQKIRNRSKTLLIPYLFWNLIVFVLYVLTQFLFPTILPGEQITDYGISDWLHSLWNSSGLRDGVTSPLNRPLWYVRDLMVVVLCSPLIYLLIRYFKLLGVSVLGVLWLLDVPSFVGFSFEAFFFFSLGALFGINKKRFLLENVKGKWLIVACVIYSIIAIIMVNGTPNGIISRLMAVLRAVIYLFITAYFINQGSWEPNRLLAESSFFLYCYHGVVMTALKSIIIKLLSPTSDISYVATRLLVCIVVIAIGIILYWILSRYLPRFTAFITGGRIQKAQA